MEVSVRLPSGRAVHDLMGRYNSQVGLVEVVVVLQQGHDSSFLLADEAMHVEKDQVVDWRTIREVGALVEVRIGAFGVEVALPGEKATKLFFLFARLDIFQRVLQEILPFLFNKDR